MTATDETDITPRPPHLLLVIAGAIGLAAAFQLTIDKFVLLQNKIDGVESSFSCDFSAFVSCGGVMDSDQAAAFGFPNSLIGVVGFAVVTALGVMFWIGAPARSWLVATLWAGTLFGIGFVTWLQFQSIYRLELLCPYCMVVWAVMIPLFVYVSAYALRRLHPQSGAARFVTNWSLLIVALWYVAVASAIWFQFGERLWA